MDQHEEAAAPAYVYTYACHEDELPLCRLEHRSLFCCDPGDAGYVVSRREVDPSRSPFTKLRLAVRYDTDSLEQMAQSVEQLSLRSATFKVVYVETGGTVDYDRQRAVERLLGSHIRGKAEMRRPQRTFGIAHIEGRWLFGECSRNEAVWLRHNEKPQQYSTALSTRVARAVANIAVPEPAGTRAIDPCCGIGTVVLEALSMGIDIVGNDINPLAVRGARVNLAHYGHPNVVSLGDIRRIEGHYDVAIVDLPYNLCSVLTTGEQLEMLTSARRLAGRAVIIATDMIDEAIEQAGFVIADRCEVRKGRFVRHIFVCA
ncbi:RNA methyltransferase [Paenibacillus sp. H1-7]|uniref:TRM11 family SAM-dependent methyltransferase n=1 Tax=Paenibacillus sp. H1-7 TaxID=2282849 RepID=UPI001EF760F3|nr:RNA methyltransferase [Paenibacillus sp. H1-7]ULL13977.1 RNA methyltransferase [Paenibacillus sp. H1-7]